MKKVILFTLLSLISARSLAEDGFAQFYHIYLNLIAATSVEQFEAITTKRVTTRLKDNFKKSCGVKCRAGLSKEWEVEYEFYLGFQNANRKAFMNIKHCSLNYTNHGVTVTLAKRSCDDKGRQSQEMLDFVKEGQSWKIDAIKTSKWAIDDKQDFPDGLGSGC